jgi:hypothetical protein
MPRFSGDQARQAVEDDAEDRPIGGARRQVDFDLLFQFDDAGGALDEALEYEKEDTLEVLDLIERDPRYGPALSMMAVCQHHLDNNGWVDDRETTRTKAIDFARRALRVAADDPEVLARAAFVLARFGEDIDVKQVGRELGVRYVLGFRIRVMAGTADVSTTGRFFPKGSRSMRQGATRYERAHNYVQSGHATAAALQTSCAWAVIGSHDTRHRAYFSTAAMGASLVV